MTIEELLVLVADAIEYEGQLTESIVIEDIKSWDSLGQMSILSLMDSLKIEIDNKTFVEATTIQDFLTSVKFVE